MELLFVDTETGGLNPRRHSLLQVGMVAVKDGVVQGEFDAYVKRSEYVVTPKAMEINGLDLSLLQTEGKNEKDLIALIITFIQTHFSAPPIVAGHNVSFDVSFVSELFERNEDSFSTLVSHRKIDTMSWLWLLHAAGKVPLDACSSQGAFKYFNIEQKKAHDALSDARATKDLFFTCVEVAKQ